MGISDTEFPSYMQVPEVQMFSDATRRFFEREAPPERVDRWRAQHQVDRDLWTRAGESGFLGVAIPAKYGGGGGDFRHDLVVIEQMARQGVEGFGINLHNVIVLPYILKHGTEEQRQRWLPRLCRGELIAAIAMSEPDAGSDLQSIRTVAVPEGDGYRIRGAKTFISNGQLANLIVVVAKTDPSLKAKGISLFVVETDGLDGFKRGRVLDKIGNTAQDTSELFFEDMWVPKSALLGEQEGHGFTQLMAELPRERLMIACASLFVIERALRVTTDYVKTRQVFGQPLFSFQNTQFKLAEMKAKAVVARALVDNCVEKLLSGALDNVTAAVAKLWLSEAEWQVVDECLQLHGGYGYINEYPIAHMFRNSRVQRIYGGSNEVMKVIIARSI